MWKPVVYLAILGLANAAKPASPNQGHAEQVKGATNPGGKPAVVSNSNTQSNQQHNPRVDGNSKPIPQVNPQVYPVVLPRTGASVAVMQLPGLVQPAAGQAVAFRMIEMNPGLRFGPGHQIMGARQLEMGHSRVHSFFDALLIVMCIAAVMALVYIHRSRPPAPREIVSKLSSSYELHPTGAYGSFKNESAIL